MARIPASLMEETEAPGSEGRLTDGRRGSPVLLGHRRQHSSMWVAPLGGQLVGEMAGGTGQSQHAPPLPAPPAPAPPPGPAERPMEGQG